MPQPNSNEDEETFMNRCIPQLIAEGRPRNQAIAICLSKWRNRKAETDEPKE